MINKLNDYVNDKINYTPIINIAHNYDIYTDLGEFAYKIVFNSKLPNAFNYIEKHLKSNNLIKKIVDFKKTKRIYNLLGIRLLTQSDYVIDKLKELYGEPIYHDKFGEGFEGEYDEDNDEYSQQEIKESFASYFININNVDFHIGYDHRGLTIEVNPNTKIGDLINSLKELLKLLYTNNKKMK